MMQMPASPFLLSSPRRRGPITSGIDYCGQHLPQRQQAKTGRMGPRRRGDDAGDVKGLLSW